jgi:hypothetical protein
MGKTKDMREPHGRRQRRTARLTTPGWPLYQSRAHAALANYRDPTRPAWRRLVKSVAASMEFPEASSSAFSGPLERGTPLQHNARAPGGRKLAESGHAGKRRLLHEALPSAWVLIGAPDGGKASRLSAAHESQRVKHHARGLYARRNRFTGVALEIAERCSILGKMLRPSK